MTAIQNFKFSPEYSLSRNFWKNLIPSGHLRRSTKLSFHRSGVISSIVRSFRDDHVTEPFTFDPGNIGSNFWRISQWLKCNFLPYSFQQNRFYGVRSLQRPPSYIKVKYKKYLVIVWIAFENLWHGLARDASKTFLSCCNRFNVFCFKAILSLIPRLSCFSLEIEN